MKIKNVRMGFATNSSSTHSIIFAGTNDPSLTVSSESGSLEYGWDRFICDSKEKKRDYFAAQLITTLNNHLGEDVSAYVVKGLFGINIEKGQYGYPYGVDHQSRWDIPVDFNGDPNVEFYKEFAYSVINNEKLNVLGGNDNTSYTDEAQVKEPAEYSWLQQVNEVSKENAPIAYKTKSGDWVLFNKGSGSKIVLNFEQEEMVKEDYKAEHPELIDLKITDYCPIGCTYCYQDSTTKGAHAPLKAIRGLLPWTNEGLFEIAIGGGEPTMHPEFVDILKTIKENNIIANFTTKNKDWFSNIEFACSVLDNVGAFAYSIDTAYEAEKVLKKYESLCDLLENYKYQGKINFQYIPEGNDLGELERIIKVLEEIGFNNSLTLLGYKTTGRGGSIPYKHDLINELLRLKQKYKIYFNIGIDTVLAKRFESDLKTKNVSDLLFYKEEGKHSMYIDAVDMKYGASSFTDTYHEIKTANGYSPVSLKKMFEKIKVE
ncbi:radical SAM protein [bacterium]|nr:radical SAM protein [bacterium]